MRFRCANRISIFLRSRRDCSKASVPAKRTGNVSGVLVDVARDLARWHLRTALRFERAYVAVELAGAIEKRLAIVHECPLVAKRFPPGQW